MITNEEAKERAREICACLEHNNEIKQQRKKLSEQVNQAEAKQQLEVVRTLSEENRALAYRLRDISGNYDHLKQELAKEIAASERSFALLDAVSTVDNELARQINSLFMAYDTFKVRLGGEIRTHYGLSSDYDLHVLAKERGASTGFVVQIENHTYYIKESLSYRENKKINPKELFLYKLLEYVHLGPKTDFILHSFSTSRTGAHICYISTQDVAYTKITDKQKTFSTDNPNEHEEIGMLEEKIEQCEEALNDENFRRELLALSMLEDVFYINDSLRTNPSNYGIVRIEDSEHVVRYKPKLIDHLPDRPNIYFNYQSIDSAIKSLHFKITINKERRERQRKQPAMFFTIFNRMSGGVSDYFSTAEVLQAYSRLIDGKPDKENSDILTVMFCAQEEINGLIDSFSDSFVDGAREILAAYCEKARPHINTLQELFSAEKSALTPAL